MKSVYDFADYPFQFADVLTESYRWNRNPLRWLLARIIVAMQRLHFGKKAFCSSVHVYFYLGNGLVTDCPLPSVRLVSLKALTGERLRCYRYRHYECDGDHDLEDYVNEIVESYRGHMYDVADLFQFLVAEAVGPETKLAEFAASVIGTGKKRMVCSTYVHMLYRRIRSFILKTDGLKLPKLFGGVPVELTYPAYFDNSPDDFDFIASFGS